MNALTRSEVTASVVSYAHHLNRPARDRFSNKNGFTIGVIPGLKSSLYEFLILQRHPYRVVTELISCEEPQIEDNL